MKQTLLLIDDNQDMIAELLEELSERYRVITASNGKEAIGLLVKEYVHIIVSEVMTPTMSGLELCNYIKTTTQHHHIPVILMTARSSMQSRIEGLKMGADAYIEKPFDIEYLIAHISNLIANRNRIREHVSNHLLATINVKLSCRSEEELFKEQTTEIILQNLEDLQLDVNKLARMMNLSRTNLFRKIKQYFDQTPNDLIKILRLRKAAELLITTEYKIYEICDMVGFGTQTNFGRNFYKEYGTTPTEFQRQIKSSQQRSREMVFINDSAA